MHGITVKFTNWPYFRHIPIIFLDMLTKIK